ncbi:MAG: acetyl-CoA carboxylase biotin carboxyl carrier protein [Bacilli bacterium]
MLKLNEIKELIELLDQSSIDKFSYEVEGHKIQISKHKDSVQVISPNMLTAAPQVVSTPQPQVAAPVAQPSAPVETKVAVDENTVTINAPMVGTFYAAQSPETPDFVSVGSKVNPKSVVCIVEAMKLFNEIEAEVSGEVVEILVENGQLVEYGQPMFRVKSNA